MRFSWTFREGRKVRAAPRVQQGMSTPRRFALALVGYLSFLTLVDVSAYLGILPTKLRAIPLYDTIGHFGLLGIAGLLLHRALGRRSVRVKGVPLPVGPMLVVIGAAAEELLQIFSPVRECCFSDFAADVVGIALFWGIDTLWHRTRQPARA